MKFDQLVEHNMKNIFAEKSYTKCAGETIPTYQKKKKKFEHISGSIV